MKKFLIFVCGILTTIAFITCTNPAGSGGPPTYTVNGTLTLLYTFTTGNAVITATAGSNTYSSSIAVTPQDNSNQTSTYTIIGVPAGTYSISFVITSLNAPATGNYTINGTTTSDLPVATGSSPLYTQTLTVSNISVSANTQLNAEILGPPLPPP
jgi:hypothetical protein